MNYKVMGRFISKILAVEAVFMTPAMLICVFDKEYKAFISFVLSILIIMAVSALLFVLGRKAKQRFFVKEGLACVGLSWIAISLLGCLPFYISGEIPHFIDALFEMVSGFTTTGSSILPEVETMSRGMLYWRSFSHWLGGMGVLVFLLAVTPANGRSNRFTLHLLRAESPGPNVEKLAPRMRDTAMILYMLYMALTVINVIFLLLGGMSLFDSVCTAFGTAGTGGFGIKNDSMAGYSPYIQNVCTIFMLLFGVNFSCYYLLLLRRFKTVLKDGELRLYLGLVVASITAITINIYHMFGSIGEALHHAAFTVASIITTTGFATVDFDKWPEFSKSIIVVLMMIGACAGSTGGGFKCGRLLLLLKSIRRGIRKTLNPNKVEVIRNNGNAVNEKVISGINIYVATYFIIIFGSFLLIAVDGFSIITNFTAVLSCFNNIGPGLDQVGPTCNFGLFSDFSKIILIIDMLAGRLEIYPILILFSRDVWSFKR
ncbi:TrkH family potassium uptake protein [Eubacterium sp. AF15-50]|uniref:TrkH family potassium uptake protein n=1 Tax=unclassified Eubacterium (in: firmicutes) TaxID=2624479 RepID=UPI000E49E36C|nr:MULTISPECIES: TrkH family potassium uptake protein [unclassified Eubacterium (in: firmicutes)]RHR73680.1 TrkH family potassium uptake protein [Eubacterium sp. AF16-48]RHR81357.1 TrkH family potassium uptake protein [Eubacterium sp. AF15-50]